ncbi:MAG: hypothetical protein LBK95_16235 [Bifidobacteriaceae bacterium]|jgi:hypothetical protein|nr:hypothetical protein [Bifidobacteriaceae bacterium]
MASEAWRNVATGTTRPWIGAGAFVATVGVIAALQAHLVVRAVDEAWEYRDAGAAVTILDAPTAISAAQCDALAETPGIVASGAVREGPHVRVAADLSVEQITLEASPGFAGLLHTERAGSSPSDGVWVSETMASRFGVRAGSPGIALVQGGDIPLAGIFAWPDDGRDPSLGFSIVSPVAPVGLFDSCWIETWPEGSQRDLARLAIDQSGGVDAARGATTRQLNATLGTSFDGPARYRSIPAWPLTAAACAAAFATGFTLVRVRRLSLASALHAGLAKATLAVQLLMETVWWLIPALALSAAGTWGVASHGNPDSTWAAAYPGLRCLLLAAIVALTGSLTAALATRERHLFRYFKAR